jgi:hypothetical protein
LGRDNLVTLDGKRSTTCDQGLIKGPSQVCFLTPDLSVNRTVEIL